MTGSVFLRLPDIHQQPIRRRTVFLQPLCDVSKQRHFIPNLPILYFCSVHYINLQQHCWKGGRLLFMQCRPLPPNTPCLEKSAQNDLGWILKKRLGSVKIRSLNSSKIGVVWVRLPLLREKGGLASTEKPCSFLPPLSAEKPRNFLGFSGVHLFCTTLLVPVAGVEPARHRWRRILSDTKNPDFDGT